MEPKTNCVQFTVTCLTGAVKRVLDRDGWPESCNGWLASDSVIGCHVASLCKWSAYNFGSLVLQGVLLTWRLYFKKWFVPKSVHASSWTVTLDSSHQETSQRQVVKTFGQTVNDKYYVSEFDFLVCVFFIYLDVKTQRPLDEKFWSCFLGKQQLKHAPIWDMHAVLQWESVTSCYFV